MGFRAIVELSKKLDFAMSQLETWTEQKNVREAAFSAAATEVDRLNKQIATFKKEIVRNATETGSENSEEVSNADAN